MDDDERAPAAAEARADRGARLLGDAKGEMPVASRAAGLRDEIELALHFMPDLSRGLRIRHPVGQELIRIFVAVRETARNAGEVTEVTRGQRVLAVDGEDHRRVEASRSQVFNH